MSDIAHEGKDGTESGGWGENAFKALAKFLQISLHNPLGGLLGVTADVADALGSAAESGGEIGIGEKRGEGRDEDIACVGGIFVGIGEDELLRDASQFGEAEEGSAENIVLFHEKNGFMGEQKSTNRCSSLRQAEGTPAGTRKTDTVEREPAREENRYKNSLRGPG